MRFTDVVLTRRFARSYRKLTRAQQEQCDRTVRRLLLNPAHPGLRLKPIEPAKLYYEARLSRGDRLILRPDGSTAIVIEAVTRDEICRFERG